MFQDLASFVFVFWPGFTLGILHSLQPCEDKAIFSFYALGVSKDWREAFKMINLYGAGLLTSNLLIGLLASIVGLAFFPFISPMAASIMAGIATLIAGSYMLYSIYKASYDPHSSQKKEIGTALTRKTNSAYTLGVLAGIPPCVMEIQIYMKATVFAAAYGIPVAIFAVLMFSIGTWIGLYPLGVLGLVGSKAKKHSQSPWTIEKISAWFLIALGAIYIILALFGIYLFPPVIPNPP